MRCMLEMHTSMGAIKILEEKLLRGNAVEAWCGGGCTTLTYSRSSRRDVCPPVAAGGRGLKESSSIMSMSMSELLGEPAEGTWF